MFKTCVTIAITLFLTTAVFQTSAMAAVKKKKHKKTADGKYVSRKKSSHRYVKNSKSRRHRGSSVDLKALTTESTEAPYTQNTDNGVNPVETKPGIQ